MGRELVDQGLASTTRPLPRAGKAGFEPAIAVAIEGTLTGTTAQRETRGETVEAGTSLHEVARFYTTAR